MPLFRPKPKPLPTHHPELADAPLTLNLSAAEGFLLLDLLVLCEEPRCEALYQRIGVATFAAAPCALLDYCQETS